MAKSRRPRGFIGRRIYQLLHAPKPVFRAVFSNVSVAALLTIAYLLYDLQVDRALRNGALLHTVVAVRG
jgi:hypothetical protein